MAISLKLNMDVLVQLASTLPTQCHSGIKSIKKNQKGYVDQTHLVQDLIQKEPVKSNDGYKKLKTK